ncbi:hypothetical protein [Nostoc parmelioides]|uniref:Uncharacterized protein n=1 Tax=Nostoc parmelioides FACHB-3921 TaxID=2692909 RepID=A0ABR8BA70_9NOSO|nr:hypothetical protein [Nostoc parmelioides]MBD2250993.1 hypothetical protein [Nostoc parmelioides FACHB-3921]
MAQVNQGKPSLSELEKQIQDLKAAEAKLKAQKAAEFASKVRLVQYLEDYLDSVIKVGKLTPDTFFAVYRKYAEVYQDLDDRLWLFTKTVIKLISHPWYGVECSTQKLGNGGLKYFGKSYANPQDLYKDVLASILGDLADDPFGSDVYFYKLLQVHLADETELPADVSLNNKAITLRILKDFVALEKDPVKAPDLKDLTEDDTFYILSLVGFQEQP